MDRFKKILVPVDGKRISFECLELACHIAKQNDSEVHLVHVVNTSVLRKAAAFSNEKPDAMRKKAEKMGMQYIENFIKKIQEKYNQSFKFKKAIRHGDNVDEELINYAQMNRMDLIIIGMAAKKHASDAIVGHITLRVVEFSGVPVLTLPSKPDNYLF